jgi:hypothetical protein
MKSRSRKFKGYAVIERPDGPLIWGTFRPVELDAWNTFMRHNPQVEDHHQQAQVVRVEMTVTPLP